MLGWVTSATSCTFMTRRDRDTVLLGSVVDSDPTGSGSGNVVTAKNERADK